MSQWLPSSSLTVVEQIIPHIAPWDPCDELQLKLNEVEKIEFGLYEGSHCPHLLNAKGVAPCALHAWGSQLSACPCGCRCQRLSKHRLDSKGLFGLLVQSQLDGELFVRHINPNEAMALNTLDPTIDFGHDVKLSLSACGQNADSLQVVWIACQWSPRSGC